MRISDWSSDVYSSDLKPARGASFVTAPPPDVAPDPALSAPGAYEMVTGQAQLDAWIERLRAADEFAVDTETDSLDAMRANLVGMSFCIAPGVARSHPLAPRYAGMPGDPHPRAGRRSSPRRHPTSRPTRPCPRRARTRW